MPGALRGGELSAGGTWQSPTPHYTKWGVVLLLITAMLYCLATNMTADDRDVI